jgi:hypothetical protein
MHHAATVTPVPFARSVCGVLSGLYAVLVLTSCADSPKPISVAVYDSHLLPVLVEGRLGYIDTNGVICIEPQFVFSGEDSISRYDFAEGFAVVGIRDLDGRLKETHVDVHGERLNDKLFDGAGVFSEGLAPVRIGQSWGYIAESGRLLVPLRFDLAGPFSHGMAPVVEKQNWCVINRRGKTVIWLPPKTSLVTPFWGGDAVVCIGQKWGMIDTNGEWSIDPEYDELESFGEGNLARARKGEQYGYIDRTGGYAIKPQFPAAWGFVDGLAWVNVGGSIEYDDVVRHVVGGKWGMIDQSGIFQVEPRYDAPRYFSGGLAPVRVGATHGARGRLEGGKCGYVNHMDEMEIEPQFDDAEPFQNGIARVRIGSAYGYIDTAGKYIWKPTE